jgi:serine/threonine protein kinase
LILLDLEDLFQRLFRTDPQERITLQEILYHPWLNQSSIHPWLPSPKFIIQPLPSAAIDSWTNYKNITAICFLKNKGSFQYKIQDAVNMCFVPSFAARSEKSAVLEEISSFQDIELTEIHTSSNSYSKDTFRIEYQSPNISHDSFISSFLFKNSTDKLVNLYRFGKKHLVRTGIIHLAYDFEKILKILQIPFDVCIITKSNIIPRSYSKYHGSQSCLELPLPIENDDDISAFLFKCQYETSIRDIYVFEVYIQRINGGSYMRPFINSFITLYKSIQGTGNHKSSSSSQTLQSSFARSDFSSPLKPARSTHQSASIQYKLFISKDIHRGYVEKFENIIWNQFIKQKLNLF